MCLHGRSVERSLFAEIKEEGFYKASSTSSVLQIAIFTQCVWVCLRVPLCVQQHSQSKEPAWPLNPKYTQRRRNQTDAEQTRPLFE